MHQLLDKISKEQKQFFLLGCFNFNVLNYNEHQPTNEFLDSLTSTSIILYNFQPTSLTSHSKTLTDNIFSNVLSFEAISGFIYLFRYLFIYLFIYLSIFNLFNVDN